MSHTTSAALAGVLIFATSIWIGGLFAIVVVARVATRTLDPSMRVAFFHGLGHAYGIVGTAALAVAYATGAALIYDRSWDGSLTATAIVATALVATLATGIAQARRMTRLRERALRQAGDPALASHVRRGAGRAGALRGLIAVLSLALLALGVALGS